MQAAPLQRSEMDAKHRAARAKRRPEAAAAARKPATGRLNLGPVLTLGDEEFIQFRGRAYGVPPIPLKAGQQLLESYLAATEAARALAVAAIASTPDHDAASRYFAALRTLPKQLWKLTREPSRWRRLQRALGLRRNPFDDATEGELMELASFFYWRRTRSRGPSRPKLATRARPTSSTT